MSLKGGAGGSTLIGHGVYITSVPIFSPGHPFLSPNYRDRVNFMGQLDYMLLCSSDEAGYGTSQNLLGGLLNFSN